mgnify:CR=1 FL=1
MGLESASYPNQLVATNPTGSDPKSTADDHIRLLKSVIQATFPNLTGAVTLSQTDLNASVNASIAAAAAAGATVFNAATAYAQYAAVISPVNLQTYRRNTAGTSATDNLTATDNVKYYQSGSSTTTINFPSASANTGKRYVLSNRVVAGLTMTATSGSVTDIAGTSYPTLPVNICIEVMSDGTNWIVYRTGAN